MSKVKKNLNIIITNSFQNDFIESVDDLVKDKSENNLKLDFLKCQELWIEYFRDQNREVDQLNIDQFITWLKDNTKSQDIDTMVSYHQILEKYKHRVHINFEETKRLWKERKLDTFLRDLMKKAVNDFEKEDSTEQYQCIHLRDWHDLTDISQKGELDHFGPHCLRGTYGAKFVSPLNEVIQKYSEFNTVINSNSLSSFDETGLESVLDTIIENSGTSKNDVKIGVFGVITNVKIFLLVFELMVIHKFRNVFICGDFCAGFTKQGHIEGINSMSNILAANVVDYNKFREIFRI